MEDPSEIFICPITHELMQDPVIDGDGNSYERAAIEDWLTQHGTSPITRAPLALNDLRPNRALKTAIDEYRQKLHSANNPINSPTTEIQSIELTVSGNYVDGFTHISIVPPPDATRSPCDICCVIDTSGSMAVQAEIQNDKNEKFGLSQLDLVKHAMKTIIHSLQPQDRLSLVSFANNATILFHLRKMDQDGKSTALAALERLEDNGQTNLWDGLRTGLDILIKGQRAVGANSAIFLLTDGCPNIEPPRGHIPTLEKMKTNSNFRCTINTFGFGYDLDSKLLEDIAILGNSGCYGFIPDGSFVGTIFVNALANLLTTVATNVEVHVQGEHIESTVLTHFYSKMFTDKGTKFDLGSITHGQSKDLLIPLAPELLSKCEFYVTYDTLQEKLRSVKININHNLQQRNLDLIEEHKFRLRFVHCVRNLFEVKRSTLTNADNAKEKVEFAMNQLKTLEKDLEGYANKNGGFTKDLLTDLTGQVNEAISRDDWFKKWGIHFLPSLTRAHLLQYCNNFKDPGVQNYGQGTLFSSVRDDMDTIFCSLPAPKASQQTGAPIDMSAFYNPTGGGCFYGSCLVRLTNGTTKLVKDVVPGDRLAPYGGVVTYVVKTKCQNNKAKMVVLNTGLIITSWHPIRFNHQWFMPCSFVSAPTEIVCDEVYNFALDQGHTVLVNDIECVTLGHGFRDDIVRHSYYGTQRVIKDLHRLDLEQNRSGIIEIDGHTLMRHERNGRITGLRPQNEQYQQVVLVQ